MDNWLFLLFGSYSFSVLLYLTVMVRKPLPDPPPWRVQFAAKLAGTVGGFIGGTLASRSFGVPTPEPAISYLAWAAAGIVVGSIIAMDLYDSARATRGVNAVKA